MEMGPIGDTVYSVHQGHASLLYQDQTQHTFEYTILAEGARRRHLQYCACDDRSADIKHSWCLRCGIEAD